MEIKDKIEIIIKNFGQRYLKYILASWVVNSLFIEGAIINDWYKIIPIMQADINIGKFLKIVIIWFYMLSSELKVEKFEWI